MSEHRLTSIELDAASLPASSAEIEHERRVAIFDIVEKNAFQPAGAEGGPYALKMSSQDGRLVHAWQLGPWAVAEVHFSRLKPTLVVLHQAPDWRVRPQAVWSGSTAPWRVNDFVRRYLQQQAPEVPAELLACIDVEPLHFTAT